ncbi:4-hydroxy-3-prenylphenylpyruvate oxygenase/4-hydroxy-3-prenylbenzoate synthase [Methylobacterium crusticola]|uniref:4-hydroxy-3-prenylphenylpyruvate oxygenase/4-hydroxy-3-prenylbenzoate synthase n=1 Tax=Methylobacterium crusticola TaxID=1697972 RepID=A0ABQ4QUG7_9HYPH|nr:class II aldolase/adducin family protein [Methylobacterium crusticola]GJD48973.1 4-hydroxy-3-prenylphenylpyruvate oxygenase/4-hydroxy-3-prenylbenzoate synthase [Methylobacterium crusticola]
MSSPAPLRAVPASEAARVRVDLAAAYRLIHRLGLDDSIYTHISVRLPGPEHRFLINPYGLRFEEVTASNLVTVDLDGRVVDDPCGLGINPAGFTIHSAVHAAREDALCVLHTHTVAGVAVSCQEEGLLPLNQWSMQFTDRIAHHDYEGIALDLDERERLVADLGDRFVMILRNHGLLTCGRSVAEAFKLMHNMERSCRAQLALQAAGAPVIRPSAAVARKTAGQYAAHYDRIEASGTDTEWDAFKRMLAHSDPGYAA